VSPIRSPKHLPVTWATWVGIPRQDRVEQNAEIPHREIRAQSLTSEVHLDLRQGAQVWSAAEHHQLRFRSVYFKGVCQKPGVKGRQSALHALDHTAQVVFPARNKNLSIVGVLDDLGLGRRVAKVVGEHGVEERPQGGPLKHAHTVR